MYKWFLQRLKKAFLNYNYVIMYVKPAGHPDRQCLQKITLSGLICMQKIACTESVINTHVRIYHQEVGITWRDK